jgi:hypothetical protein
MNRRGFLSALPAALAAGELLVPKRTFFLPPRGGWFDPAAKWAVKTEGGYFYSHELRDLFCNPAFDSYPIDSLYNQHLGYENLHPAFFERGHVRRCVRKEDLSPGILASWVSFPDIR